MQTHKALIFIAASTCSVWAPAQSATAAIQVTDNTWQQCTNMAGDDSARLRCFDLWAKQQTDNAIATPTQEPVVADTTTPDAHNCKSPNFSELSRYWELEAGSDCGTFGIRGYKPISLSVIGSDSVNTQPESTVPDHSASTSQPFRTTETRIQLSIRTKIAQGLLTQNEPVKRDSLWFGYSQQSNWQLFSGNLSRPFRTTDHEPELMYIYPADLSLLGPWRLRYLGWSLNHQSNGQALPLSRSWNRSILMAGMENGSQLKLLGKLWYRLPENAADDDNPEISDLVGRGELTGIWSPSTQNAFSLTLRHSLRAQANGSARLEWLHTLSDSENTSRPGGLQLHTQLFSGYGDSLIDYNRRRTVLSVGLSLVDW